MLVSSSLSGLRKRLVAPKFEQDPGAAIGKMEPRDIVACYREFEPRPALRGRVRALFSCAPGPEPVAPGRRITLEVRFARGDRYSAPLFADSGASIVFELAVAIEQDNWSANPVAPHGKVIGPMRRVTSGYAGPLPAMVGAYLHPGELAAFTRTPSGDVSDRVVAVEEFWGPGAAGLASRLAALPESARIELLEQELLGRMADPPQAGSSVKLHKLAIAVLAERGRTSVEQLADSAGVSRQHLGRLFRERVGVSPKRFARLARFQSALSHAGALNPVDWARVAAGLGYADQSHLIAEFREFSGLTPHRLTAERWFHPFIARSATLQHSDGSPYPRR